MLQKIEFGKKKVLKENSKQKQ